LGSSRVGAVVLVLLAIALSPPAVAQVRSAATAPLHILFIGNSYTRANDLPHTVQHISEGVGGGSGVRVTAIANPGWDLSRHWFVRETRATIAGGRFSHVVLQGHSLTALQHRDEFEGYARLFASEIERIGARTVLYETWARRPGSSAYGRREHIADSPVEMQAQISECYLQLARDIGAEVAPAGRAFLLAQQRLDRPELFRSDGAHPSRNGTFLAGLVLYATITGQDPRRSTWRPHRVSRHTATELRDIAYHAVFALRGS
jgi:hypothetical protein